eukprot:755580_1
MSDKLHRIWIYHHDTKQIVPFGDKIVPFGDTKQIFAANHYIVIEDNNGIYYRFTCFAHPNTPAPITYFKNKNIKLSHVFVSHNGDAPFWKADDGTIYTSSQSNWCGNLGVEVDENKPINEIPFLSQLSIKKIVSGGNCSIAICNDGSVYSTGTGTGHGDNGLGANGVVNRLWKRIECLEEIIDCDFGFQFV